MKEHYYLDNAGTTWPKPEPVYEFMDRFYRSHGVNPGRGGYELAVEAEAMILETRRLLAEFFNHRGDPQRVVFTQNVTDALNIALYGVLSPGDHVVSTRLEHNSVLRPLNHLSRDNGVSVTLVGRDAEGYVDPEEIRRSITPRTKVVAINHGSNVLGSVQDLAAIGEVVADSPAYLVIDTAQTAGVLPLDMSGWGVDILTFTGHKGLFGPMGIGGMVVREGVDVRPARFGGTGVESISPYHVEAYPHRLEAGTVSIPGIAGLNAAQKWFADLGRERGDRPRETLSHREACEAALRIIESTECMITRRLISQFDDHDRVTVYGPRGNRDRVSTFTININEIPADQAGIMLDADYHVCVRGGLHCAPLVHEDEGTVPQNGSVRIAPGFFTDDEDVDQLVTGVLELAENRL